MYSSWSDSLLIEDLLSLFCLLLGDGVLLLLLLVSVEEASGSAADASVSATSSLMINAVSVITSITLSVKTVTEMVSEGGAGAAGVEGDWGEGITGGGDTNTIGTGVKDDNLLWISAGDMADGLVSGAGDGFSFSLMSLILVRAGMYCLT